MSAEANKAVGRRWMDEVLNKRDLVAADEIYPSDVADHYHSGPPRAFIPRLETALPDFHFTTDDLFAGEDDKVVVRFTFRGTHAGEFAGIAPTGNVISFEGIAIMRIAGGKIREFWEQADIAGMMQQLRGVPTPG